MFLVDHKLWSTTRGSVLWPPFYILSPFSRRERRDAGHLFFGQKSLISLSLDRHLISLSSNVMTTTTRPQDNTTTTPQQHDNKNNNSTTNQQQHDTTINNETT